LLTTVQRQINLQVLDEVDADWWNEMVAGHADGNLMQTTYWADLLQSNFGDKPHYLLASDEDDNPLGLLLFFQGPLLRDWPFSWGRSLQPFFNNFLPVYTWLNGPLVLVQDDIEGVLQSIIAQVNQFGREQGLYGISKVSCPLVSYRDKLDEIMQHEGFSAVEHATFHMDLSPTSEELWNKAKREARKAVRKAGREGIVVRRLTSVDELEIYWHVMQQTWRRLGIPHSRDKDMLYAMWHGLKPTESVEFFLAEQDDEPVGVLGVTVFNGLIQEFASGRTEQAKVGCGDAIKWAVIEWAAAMGHQLYDLSGVIPLEQVRSDKEKGIFRFKEKWGGQYLEYQIHSMSYPSLQQKLIDAVDRLRRTVAKSRSN